VGRIVVLDAITAGRIAAGEVVERPASVVKELVENALDAGARRIEVELEDGGRTLIKVADDGEGMDAPDARLAFERHATSKLTSAEDLDDVGTYGFRGEALPSIGAVARVRLVSCLPEAGEGVEVLCEGGLVSEPRPGPARPGTVVWVRDLYFNTPARRQAMRSAAAEVARVSEVAGTLALAVPGVALSLVSEGKLLWSTPGSGSLEDAVVALFGAEFARSVIAVDGRSGPVRVTGLAGLPGVARRDGKRQYLFCNARPINPKLLRGAYEEAYRTLLQAGRTPVFILNLSLEPASVDVNIHPAKTQVRFRDHGLVYRATLSALRAALGRADLFGGRLAGYPAARETASAAETAVPADWRDVLGRGAGWFGRETLPPYAADDASESPESRGGDWAWPRDLAYLGQVGRTFLVARAADGLYVIDQHAAHERVVLERLVAAGAGEVDPEARTDQQLLAVPVTVELAPGEEDVLERSLAFLRRVGFELEAFGGRTVLIRAVPAVLSGVPVGGLIADFLDRLGAEGGPGTGAEKAGVERAGAEETGAERAGVPGARGSLAASFDRFRAARVMAACQASLKAGQGLSEAEAEALLGDLGRTSEPRTCPHGRPTLLRIGLDELERSFGRGRG